MTLIEMPDLPGRALCAETDPEAFFPDNGRNGRDARALCGHCEIRDACLQWALATGERYGIWGGLNVKERRALRGRQQRPVATCGTSAGYNAHKRRGEQPCDDCVEGRRTYNRELQYRTGRRTPQPQNGAA